ncbi:cation:proton antiporter [Rhodopirellula sp. JC737]|nr:cation:proton antiporter [Rhodopirellula sp. JC737]
MMDFFPNLHFDDPLFNMAIVLTAGVLGGELFALIRLPKVTGWIATGILLRQLRLPGMDTVVDPSALDRFGPYMNFVLGFIAFTVGATLYFGSLRNTGKRIGLLLLGEALITPLSVGLLMYFGGRVLDPSMALPPAALFAAIAIAGAPGTTVLVIQEARARGILTRTLLAAIGLIDMVAVAVFVFISTFLADQSGWLHALESVGVQFAVTFVIGALCSLLAIVLVRTVVSPAFLGPLMVAVVLGAWGAAASFGTSGGILACTFAGITLTNSRHDLVRSGEAYLNSIGGALFALFYTFAGMKLDFTQIPPVIGLVALYFLARLAAKSVSAYVAMTLSGATDNLRRYLGMSLLPHGGVAVGLILLVASEQSGFSEEVKSLVTTVGLSALAINQLLGPSATRFALTQTGEAKKDRPRLLDFLQENRIMVDLDGDKQEIFQKLTGLLYATTPMKVPQEKFIESVWAREESQTTCLGSGLMIPHAIIDEPGAKEVKGVLGISKKGIALDTPDGRLVHAVLLLATPESSRKRHLEILAAFATAITRDINIREQLYRSRSPAHAYEVLHADDLNDLNYFLEDAQERAGLLESNQEES